MTSVDFLVSFLKTLYKYTLTDSFPPEIFSLLKGITAKYLGHNLSSLGKDY